jgi:hypothetical protein
MPIQMPELSWDKAQQQQQAYELFPSDNSHITVRVEETNAALQAGMPPTQNIEHVSLAMHYTNARMKLG